MLISTCAQLPANTKLIEIMGFIEYTAMIKISSKGVLESLFSKKKDAREIAYEELKKLATSYDANAIIGLQISTTTAAFKDGTFLYITYAGTAVVIDEGSSSQIKG